MDIKKITQQLRDEGFPHTYVWQDEPHASYPDHSHATETAHVILDGEMTVTIAGSSVSYGTGERCNVPADEIHAARIGAAGCRYVIGER